MTALLHVLSDPPLDGPENMARDECLLHDRALQPAVLRLYEWSPATLSLGYFQRIADARALADQLPGVAVVRRPTGGGAILHDRELTYCLIADDTLEAARRGPTALYELVHEVWREVLDPTAARMALAPDHMPLPTPRSGPFFCFEKPGRTDLLIGEEKVLGSAQRRIPGRVLQHGSLILGRRFQVHPGAHLNDPSAQTVVAWRSRFAQVLAERLDLSVAPAEWSAAALAEVSKRREKYAGAEWTEMR
ncbi:MAG: lipoate--protein ligase family protein [Phycisphaerales bacterium]|nr:lipoate--protein ligase family protein [Phycisphaerales bacterium]